MIPFRVSEMIDAISIKATAEAFEDQCAAGDRQHAPPLTA